MEHLFISILFIIMCITYYITPHILNRLVRTILGLVMCISLSGSVTLAFMYDFIEYILPMIIGIILIELMDLKIDKHDINIVIKAQNEFKQFIDQEKRELLDKDKK